MRQDGRAADALRMLTFTRGFITHPEGSVLAALGDTKVICNATVEDKVPPFLQGTGKGWLTAEYAMLPRATSTRNARDVEKLKKNARAVEIQRLIGRALRMAIDLEKLGERTIIIDCDVIQADGGTRTTAISGGFVALVDACAALVAQGALLESPIKQMIAAVSVGVVDGVPLLDLCYEEDSRAEVDMNIVMNPDGAFIELQGSAENAPFSHETLTEILRLGAVGSAAVIQAQKDALGWK